MPSSSDKSVARRAPAKKRGPAMVYSWDLATAAEEVREGLPAASLLDLQERLDLSSARLGDVLSIAPRTLARRAGAARLPRDESERVYRLGRLASIAAEILGGMEAARQWFKEPNYALGDRTPLDMASTEPGAQLVERTLRHIEHGIPV
jgi:putative toxin-antitoxin system antitoxin component (TIGR02293 family)